MTEITRAKHLAFCKARALRYVELGDLNNALASMASDLQKHEGTRDHSGLLLQTQMQMAGMLRTSKDVREWIEGFN